MIKLHQQLEQVLHIRINSNSEIVKAIKTLMELGKLDKPKEIAMMVIILDRLGKLEDDDLIEQSLKELTENKVVLPVTPPPTTDPVSAPVNTESTPEPVEPVKSAEDSATLSTPETPTTPDVSPASEPTPESPTVSQFTPENITNPTIPSSSEGEPTSSS